MMGGVSPETCWASYKHGIINSGTLLHLVGYFYRNYTMMHGSTNIKRIDFFVTLWSENVSENLETTQSEFWMLNLSAFQMVSGSNLILYREQHFARELRVEWASPPYSEQNYSSALKLEVGSWSFRNVGTYLPTSRHCLL